MEKQSPYYLGRADSDDKDPFHLDVLSWGNCFGLQRAWNCQWVALLLVYLSLKGDLLLLHYGMAFPHVWSRWCRSDFADVHCLCGGCPLVWYLQEYRSFAPLMARLSVDWFVLLFTFIWLWAQFNDSLSDTSSTLIVIEVKFIRLLHQLMLS